MTADQWKKIFAERLRSSIRRSGMTNKEVAERANVSNASISQYLNGSQIPTVSAATNLARVLGVEIDYLVDFNEIIN